MSEIQFIKEEPPATTRSGPTTELIEALKTKPGTWAIIAKFTGEKVSQAGAKASYLRRTVGIETVSRKGVVYARYVEGVIATPRVKKAKK